MRQLAYGGAADSFIEYLRIGETTAIKCLRMFCVAVVRAFKDVYIHMPASQDVARLLSMHEEKQGFPRMLGRIDCMHWAWKNCPKAHAGAYTRGDQGCPMIILEAVASQDLWMWHAFFGAIGSNININVLNASPLFQDTLDGTAPIVNCQVGASNYTQGYYLADDIYLNWLVLVKSVHPGVEEKKKRFSKMQQTAGKDVEQAFGVLQARCYIIIRGPTRGWYQDNLKDVMLACIITHNMIIEDEALQKTA